MEIDIAEIFGAANETVTALSATSPAPARQTSSLATTTAP